MKTRLLFELETSGIPNLHRIMQIAENRVSDVFTNAGVNVKSCAVSLLPSEQPEVIGLVVRDVLKDSQSKEAE